MAAKKKPEAPPATEPVIPVGEAVQEPVPVDTESVTENEAEPVAEQWEEDEIQSGDSIAPEAPPATEPPSVTETPPAVVPATATEPPAVDLTNRTPEPPPPPRFTARVPATRRVFHGDDLEALKTTVREHLAENKLVGDIDRLITTNF